MVTSCPVVNIPLLFVGTGVVFSGRLDTGLPTDQSAKYSGYCAIRSKPKKVRWLKFSHCCRDIDGHISCIRQKFFA